MCAHELNMHARRPLQACRTSLGCRPAQRRPSPAVRASGRRRPSRRSGDRAQKAGDCRRRRPRRRCSGLPQGAAHACQWGLPRFLGMTAAVCSCHVAHACCSRMPPHFARVPGPPEGLSDCAASPMPATKLTHALLPQPGSLAAAWAAAEAASLCLQHTFSRAPRPSG